MNHDTCAAIAALRRVVMPVFRGALSDADFCAGTLEEAIVRKDFAAALSIVESFPLSAKCDIDGSPPLLVIARCRPCPLELMLALIRAHPAVCATPIVVNEGLLGIGRRETYLLHQCAASAVAIEGELRESEDLDLGVNTLDVVRALLAAAPQVARLLDDNDRVPAALVLHRLPDEGTRSRCYTCTGKRSTLVATQRCSRCSSSTAFPWTRAARRSRIPLMHGSSPWPTSAQRPCAPCARCSPRTRTLPRRSPTRATLTAGKQRASRALRAKSR